MAGMQAQISVDKINIEKLSPEQRNGIKIWAHYYEESLQEDPQDKWGELDRKSINLLYDIGEPALTKAGIKTPAAGRETEILLDIASKL